MISEQEVNQMFEQSLTFFWIINFIIKSYNNMITIHKHVTNKLNFLIMKLVVNPHDAWDFTTIL